MGQMHSEDKIPEWVDIQRHAATIKELTFLSYEHFVSTLKELNKISQTFTDSNGKRLVFAVKRGTDCSVFWKATVKIGCVKVGTDSKIDSYRLLNLKQYLQVYQMIMCQVDARNQSVAATTTAQTSQEMIPDTLKRSAESEILDNDDLSKPNSVLACGSGGSTVRVASLTTSMILDKVGEANNEHLNSLDECCICLERKPEVILPCAHSYCVPCIEQWNVTSRTCPVCREEIRSTDDSWVISEAPDSDEIAAEVQKLLSGLAEKQVPADL